MGHYFREFRTICRERADNEGIITKQNKTANMFDLFVLCLMSFTSRNAR